MRKKTRRNRFFVVGLTACAGLILLTRPAIGQPDIYRVDPHAPGPTHNGLSWPTAFLTIEDAFDAAEFPGDEIWVRYETYVPQREYVPGPDPRTKTFLLKDEVAVYGGFLGTADPGGGESDVSERNVYLNETILSGDLGEGLYAYHVVTSQADGFGTRLDGFTVKDGRADDNGVYKGAGLYASGSETGVIRCTFEHNYAEVPDGLLDDAKGGAISVGGIAQAGKDQPFRIINCIFHSNHADSDDGWDFGGALFNGSTSITDVVNSLFYNNYCAGSPAFGGAICNDGAMSLTNCTIADNSIDDNPDGNGGGIAGFQSSGTTMVNCVLWGTLTTRVGSTPITR